MAAEDGVSVYVVAVNDWGESDSSTVVSMAVTIFVPDVPTGFVFESVGDIEITISWTAPLDNGGTEITGYQVQYYNKETFVLIDTVETALTKTIGELSPDTEYTIDVKAINAKGES